VIETRKKLFQKKETRKKQSSQFYNLELEVSPRFHFVC